MPHCDLAKQCAFFTVRDEGAEMREYLTQLYCAGNFSDCARYRAAMEMGQLVRDDIFPNEDAFLSLFAWSVNSGKARSANAAAVIPSAGHHFPCQKRLKNLPAFFRQPVKLAANTDIAHHRVVRHPAHRARHGPVAHNFIPLAEPGKNELTANLQGMPLLPFHREV